MNEAFLKRVDRWLGTITAADTIVIIHDKDPDGVCSAAILSRMLLKRRGRGADLATHVPGSSAYGPTPALLRRLRKLKPTRIITTDLGLDSEPATVKALCRIAPTLILDHHKLYDPLRFPGCFLVKPQFFCDIEPSRYATAKLAYDLASRLADMREADWLAAAGSCADQATRPWRRWLASVARRRRHAWDPHAPFRSIFGMVADRIQLAINGDERLAQRAFQLAERASGPHEFLQDPVLKRTWSSVKAEIRNWLAQVRKRADWHKDLRLIYYRIRPRYHIKPTLTTLLALRHPRYVVVTTAREDGRLGVSARTVEGTVAVNDLLQAAIKGLPRSRGGGHRRAAGADIPAKYEKIFGKRIVKLLGER